MRSKDQKISFHTQELKKIIADHKLTEYQVKHIISNNKGYQHKCSYHLRTHFFKLKKLTGIS